MSYAPDPYFVATKRYGYDRPSPFVSPSKMALAEIMAEAWTLTMRFLPRINIVLILYFGAIIALTAVAEFLMHHYMQPALRYGNRPLIELGLFAVLFGLITFYISFVLQVGFKLFLVNLVRGTRPRVSDLVAGAPWFWRALRMTLLNFFWHGSLIFLCGLAIYLVGRFVPNVVHRWYGYCLITACTLSFVVYLGIGFWFAMFVMIDHDCNVFASYAMSFDIMRRNRLRLCYLMYALLLPWVIAGFGFWFLIGDAFLDVQWMLGSVLWLGTFAVQPKIPISTLALFLIPGGFMLIWVPFVALCNTVAYFYASGQPTVLDMEAGYILPDDSASMHPGTS